MAFYWYFKKFSALTTLELYEMLALRQSVFIVEQRDIYLDADGKDIDAVHVMGYEEDKLVAYARVMVNPLESIARFGRVIVHEAYRGKGLAKALLQKILHYLQQEVCSAYPIHISAQVYLLDFYKSFGFVPVGEVYLEGAIAHRDMILQR